jgi:hypothetical protein
MSGLAMPNELLSGGRLQYHVVWLRTCALLGAGVRPVSRSSAPVFVASVLCRRWTQYAPKAAE